MLCMKDRGSGTRGPRAVSIEAIYHGAEGLYWELRALASGRSLQEEFDPLEEPPEWSGTMKALLEANGASQIKAICNGSEQWPIQYPNLMKALVLLCYKQTF
jgi:hypothetical protein